ncbi:hypothetical protein HLV40_15190 [Chromohalobacter salexigens]|nr:hypothetical protein [Chromohalobacter salexigens]
MIDAMITQLQGGGFTAARSSDAEPARTDTVPVLVTLVDPVVDSKLWPLNLPEQAPATNGVYQLVGWNEIDVDGYRLGRVDTYVLSLRSPQFDPLRTMTDDLIDRVAAHRGTVSWSITDAATDYEPEPLQYRAHFELQAAALAMTAPAVPAAFVHVVGASPSENDLDAWAVRQTVTEQIAVVIVADQDDIEAQRRGAGEALLGMDTGDDGVSPLVYLAGQPAAISGRHVYWRELYGYQRLIQST